jgi:hypothetical protein
MPWQATDKEQLEILDELAFADSELAGRFADGDALTGKEIRHQGEEPGQACGRTSHQTVTSAVASASSAEPGAIAR